MEECRGRGKRDLHVLCPLDEKECIIIEVWLVSRILVHPLLESGDFCGEGQYLLLELYFPLNLRSRPPTTDKKSPKSKEEKRQQVKNPIYPFADLFLPILSGFQHFYSVAGWRDRTIGPVPPHPGPFWSLSVLGSFDHLAFQVLCVCNSAHVNSVKSTKVTMAVGNYYSCHDMLSIVF